MYDSRESLFTSSAEDEYDATTIYLSQNSDETEVIDLTLISD